MNTAHDIQNIELTASEIAELYNAYINNSGSIFILSYFAEKVQDPDIAAIIKQSSDLANMISTRVAEIFNSVNHPIPRGFSKEDVDLTAKKLYSDSYMLTYVRFMARFGLTHYSEARASCTRTDVRQLFNDALQQTIDALNNADEVLLAKGIFSKPPVIPIPKQLDIVKDQGYLGGFLKEKRPLNATEINRIYLNFQRNSLGKALLTGFCQISTNKEIKEYFRRGREIAEKHLVVMRSLLDNDGLATPPNFDEWVSDSTEPAFSEHLMLFVVVALASIGLSVDGITLSRSMRKDISVSITRLMGEVALYAEDGFNLMIKNEWFERLPENIDRKELIKK